MFKKYKNRTLFLITLLVLIFIGIGINQLFILDKAHSTFENYYEFRNCTQLIEKTDTYGICKIPSGEKIKIVEINNKWYLEGDGPGVW